MHLSDSPPEFGYTELRTDAWAWACSPTCPLGLFCVYAAPVRHARGESWIKLGFVYILGVRHRSRSVFQMFVYLENSVTWCKCKSLHNTCFAEILGCVTVIADSLLRSFVSDCI